MYRKMQPAREKQLTVEGFGEGMDRNTFEPALTYCENMELSHGALVSRKGIKLKNKNLFHASTFSISDCSNIIGRITVDGKTGTLYSIRDTEEAQYVCFSFKAVFDNGGFKDMGRCEFTYVTTGQYSHPEAMFAFSGKPTLYSGIYLVYGIGSEHAEEEWRKKNMRIYEYDAQNILWQNITSQNLYVPTVYKFGRGDSYTYSNLSFPVPEYPESVNMLCERYKMYFTADGTSYIFTTPFSNFSKKFLTSVYCKVEIENGKKIGFYISEGNIDSGYTTYNDKQVRMFFDYEGGYISFDGFVPPYTGKQNNIEITFTEIRPENIYKICMMEKTAWYNAGDSGARLCLAGNHLYPSLLLLSAPDNPLYFPEANQFYIGEASQKITALSKQNKSLVVFKEKELYCGVFNSNKFTVSRLHSEVGCDLPNTVALCGNRIVWANSDKKLYTLNALSDYGAVAVYCISKKINSMLALENFYGAAGYYYDDKYMLCLKDKIYLMDLSASLLQSNREFVNAAAFSIIKPDPRIRIKNIYKGTGNPIFIVSAKQGGYEAFFLAEFSNTDLTDEVLFAERWNSAYTASLPFECSAEFHSGAISAAQNKLFNKLYINSYAEKGLRVDYLSGTGDILSGADIDIKYTCMQHPVPFRLIPLVIEPSLRFRITSKGACRLTGYTLYYRELR